MGREDDMRGLNGLFGVLLVAGGGIAVRGCATRAEPAPLARDVWVDAMGREVASAGALWHVDEAGRVFPIDVETGQPADSYGNLAMLSGYERPDCEGSLMVGQSVPPRVPFSLGDGMGYRVREDDAPSSPAAFRSRRLPSGVCQEYLVPQLHPVAFEAPPPSLPGVPVLPYLGPLHVERRP